MAKIRKKCDGLGSPCTYNPKLLPGIHVVNMKDGTTKTLCTPHLKEAMSRKLSV
jgi:hypothetical protein